MSLLHVTGEGEIALSGGLWVANELFTLLEVENGLC